MSSVTTSSSQSFGPPQAPEQVSRFSALDRTIAGLAIGVLGLPSAWLLLFGAIVVRARLALGYWPYPRRGNMLLGTLEYPMDPKVMPVHHALIWRGLPIVMLVMLVAPIIVLIGVKSGLFRLRNFWSLLWLLQAVAVFTLLAVDPGQFWRWFGD